MYRYEYESVKVGGGFLLDNSACRHRDIIDARARDGWRYVGYVPTEFTTSGSAPGGWI